MASVHFAPEIFQRIIFFLTHDPPPDIWYRRPDVRHYASYASVSHFWQDEIERVTFAYLRLDLHRLSQLNPIVTARRRAYVRNIRLHIKLPEPGPWHSRETDDEKLRNNQAFQEVLEALLQSLSQWDAAEVHKGGVELTFHVPLPPEETPAKLRGIGIPLGQWEPRYRKSVLELTDPERIARLSPVVVITKFGMHQSSQQRHLSVVAICALFAKLPATKAVTLDWWKALRFAGMRKDIADAVSQIGHPIDEFEFCDWYPDLNGQALPSATTEILREGEEDRLTKSLHVLSQRVKDVNIRMIPINDEIFFPRAIPAGLAEPRWDRLVYFILHYPPFDPWGELLFLPDPYRDESSSESEASQGLWEIQSGSTEASSLTLDIATPAMQRFYLAAARAALQMPVLREMELVAELGSGDYWHGFRYLVLGNSASATWTSSSGFIPEDKVLEHWHKVPKKNLQSELNVVVSDDKNAV